ncbi:MAG: hemerythrin domain-containing protein [Dehalococcoidales bacterium]|nr:hemerythrin domain-containing protein [Dehalococcoidales bacterium]
MKPIGPLMREHRLIERMVAVLDNRMRLMVDTRRSEEAFVNLAVDFFRTYADRTHHGKEEDILFRELAKKELKPEDKRIMDELVQEHNWARKMVGRLSTAGRSYAQGNTASRGEVITCIRELVSFYPVHIAKEDKQFFYPCLEYLSKAEQDAMLDEFWEFDRKLIHEKYQKTVEELEKPAI